MPAAEWILMGSMVVSPLDFDVTALRLTTLCAFATSALQCQQASHGYDRQLHLGNRQP